MDRASWGGAALSGRPLPFTDQNFSLFPESNGDITTLARILLACFLTKHTPCQTVGVKTTPFPDRNCEKHTLEGGMPNTQTIVSAPPRAHYIFHWLPWVSICRGKEFKKGLLGRGYVKADPFQFCGPSYVYVVNSCRHQFKCKNHPGCWEGCHLPDPAWWWCVSEAWPLYSHHCKSSGCQLLFRVWVCWKFVKNMLWEE